MNISKKFLFFVLFGSLSMVCGAQTTATIKGKVSSEGKPIAFATVTLLESNKATTSNGEGVFTFIEVPTGSDKIKVTAAGFQTKTIDVSVKDKSNETIDIDLAEDFLKLNEVVVTGTRYGVNRTEAPVIVNVVGEKLMNATQSIAISEALNYQPGVRVETNCQNCGFTQVRMNGLDGKYSQILINGRAVFSALNSVYGLDQIPTSIVEQIEVVRSGGSALYGSNAISGTINVITKEPVENSWTVGSNLSLIEGETTDKVVNFNSSLVSEDLKSGATFYGMFRNRGDYDANNDGYSELVIMKNNTIGTKAFIKPGDQSKITLDFSSINEYRRGGDQLDKEPHLTELAEEIDSKTVFGGLTYDFWSEDKKDNFSIYSSTQATDRKAFYGGLAGRTSDADKVQVANSYGSTDDLALVSGIQYIHNFKKNVLTLGTENQYNAVDDEIKGYDRVVDQTVNNIGAYGQFEWNPINQLKALVGTRFDHSTVDGDYKIANVESQSDKTLNMLSPRLTLLYKPTNNLQFRGGYARGFRAPQAFSEDLHISAAGGDQQFSLLADNLKRETSDAYTASINLTKSFGLTQTSFLLEGFYTALQNPFITSEAVSTAMTSGGTTVNINEVRNGSDLSVFGANFEANVSPSKDLAFQLGGTFQESAYEQDEEVIGESSGGANDAITVKELVRNPNFYGYLSSNWSITEQLKIDLTGTYTGNMKVPNQTRRVVVNTDPFFDMNLKLSYHFDFMKDFHLELSGGVKNIFNSYQDDFETGSGRDSDYIYGPALPRSVFVGLKFGNLLD